MNLENIYIRKLGLQEREFWEALHISSGRELLLLFLTNFRVGGSYNQTQLVCKA